MEPGYMLKEQRMCARVLCAAARLGGEAGHRLGEEGGEWTGRRWRVSAMSSDAAQRLGRPCFRVSMYSSAGQNRGEVERAAKGRVGASPVAFGHMAISF